LIFTRIIPCLLLRGNGLVKTKKFKDAVYIGDPVNAVRIFSEKEVDELVILDIDASLEGREPNYELIAEIAGECFMPVAYGGGVSSLEQARKLIRCGIEKVVINSASVGTTRFIREIADVFGSQAVVGSVDARKTMFGGHRVFIKSGTIDTKLKPEDQAASLVQAGVGEIFLNSIDSDGQMQGYDLELIKKVSARVNVPLVACGGAGTLDHMRSAMKQGGASAVAAGSMFVFYGKHRAVLINYPTGTVI
jgi:imidazole glycerol-phosphate synthase subunit HisF